MLDSTESVPNSPRAELPTISVEQHVDAPSNPGETEINVESRMQNGLEEVKETLDYPVPSEVAADSDPALKSATEIALPASPKVNNAPETTMDNTADESKERGEIPDAEHSKTSDAPQKDLPLLPADESTSTQKALTNELEERHSQPATVFTDGENGQAAVDLNPPAVVVRAPSTELSHTQAVSESVPTSAVDPEPNSIPPPIPEKVKTPVDRSSAAGFSQHRNASVSSVRTSTPGPGSTWSHADRRSSATSLASHRTNGSRSFVSPVVFTTALETIAASREAKRSSPFKNSVDHALELVKSGRGAENPREIFEPLRMAVETHNEKLMVTGLDCIAKLVSHGFFAEDILPEHAYNSPPPSPAPGAVPGSAEGHSTAQMPLADLITSTITSAYTDTTPDAVSLQIVKALLSLVLSPTILVHHSSLLKAVRTVYNVFLLSNDPVNQMVAQGGLTQMVNHVFGRCKVGEDTLAEPRTPSAPGSRGPQSLRGGLSQNPSAATSVTSLSTSHPTSNNAGEQAGSPVDMAPSSALHKADSNGVEESAVDPGTTEPKTEATNGSSTEPVPRAP
jgi:brefeldin A-inhibited guanine nucleotide-exchange protein